MKKPFSYFFWLLISVMRIWKNAPRNCSDHVLLWRNMLLLCKVFYRITLIKCHNRTKIFSQTYYAQCLTLTLSNKSIIKISWNSRSLEIRLRLWKKCWLHCECVQIVRTSARKLCNCRWIKIRRELTTTGMPQQKTLDYVMIIHDAMHYIYKHNLFTTL